mmetsp:Transcript_16919/g.25039  ORF Transcript_16919/g.25039 Transcript_16919/m.25039 type:complete len:778 (-) Transcript_16919:30-2363(-)
MTALLDSELLIERLSCVLLGKDIDGLDEDLVQYIGGLISEGLEDVEITEDSVEEMMGPFLESVNCPDDIAQQARDVVLDMARNSNLPNTDTGTKKLKQGLVNMKLDSDLTDADQDANRYLWGTDSKVHELTNTSMEHKTKSSAKDRRKAKQELERARREFQAKVEQQQKEESAGEVAAMLLPDYTSGRNERDVQIKNVSLSLDNGQLLLDSGELKFAQKRRYGLVGKNGIGKTTLLKAIASQQVDGIGVDVLRHLRILHVRQEIKSEGNDVTVLKAVLDSDVERLSLLGEEAEILSRLEQEPANTSSDTVGSIEERRKKLQTSGEDSAMNNAFKEDLKRLDQVYARLQVLSADSAEARASMILSGLQFTSEMQRGPTSALSGGWRMRVALAAALFIEPDILMLDEPTNHLDLEAVLWLESYLVDYKHTLIVVSHDRGFLNEVCTDIIEFAHKRLTYYRGNYDTYVKTADEKIKNSMRVYQAYHDKRAHMMEFITKFRANAKRATMVQSRIKAVEKMDLEAPEPVEVEQTWRFSIPHPEPIGRPIIAIDDVSFDYDNDKTDESTFLIQKVNFGVDLTSRIGILGANGAGKSTLLNLIMGRLKPKMGNCTINGRLRIGHFTQHSADKFDLQLSAVENMLSLFKDADDQEMRSFIGKFQIQGLDAVKPMFLLSGGQKSRVAFASLAYQKPHVIIMDEPTNHLDMESIDALVEAIQDFKGGLIVVSHDQYFISNTCSELWVVGEGVASRFRGDFNEYKKHTLEKTRKRVEASVKSLSTINN